MFFRRIKSGSEDASRARVNAVQQIIAFTLSLGMIWLVFAEDSPLNKGSAPTKIAAPAGGSAPAEGSSSATVSSPDAARPAPIAPQPRTKALSPTLASTSPAITDSLVALGLADHIVARSPYCRSVDAALPVVGDLRGFDAERLALAAPEVLFVQPPLAGVDPALRDFCEAKSIKLVARRLESLADVDALVGDIATVFGVEPNVGGNTLERALGSARASIAPGARAHDGARKVLLVVSADPFLAVGSETYLDELLGGADLANALGRRGYVELSAEALVAIAPEVVVGVAETPEGARRMEELLRRVPWKESAAPRIAVDAVPGLLSPSLVAVAKRGELTRLAGAAK
jgi:ABC-type hemin transport system substrate-binding protein